MTNILVGLCVVVLGGLLSASFVGLVLGIPLMLLGFFLIAKGIFSILWGTARIAGKGVVAASRIASGQ